jgi:Kef-type K+ transport system membrane component KefB
MDQDLHHTLSRVEIDTLRRVAIATGRITVWTLLALIIGFSVKASSSQLTITLCAVIALVIDAMCIYVAYYLTQTEVKMLERKRKIFGANYAAVG